MLAPPQTVDVLRPRHRIDADGTVEGYASLFGTINSARDMIMPGAFARTLLQRGVRRIPMLFQHDPSEPIGIWDELVEDFRGLRARGRLIPDVQRAREVLSLIRAGALDGLSIGFRTTRARVDPVTRVRKLSDVELWEISIVTFPLLAGARIQSRSPDGAKRNPGSVLPAAKLTPHSAALHAGYILRLAPRAKYSPDQPRVSPGNPDGGQWTNGGGGNSDIGAARRGSPRGGDALSQQLRLDAARARSEHALNRVRELDPEWKPTPSFERINNMEGVIGRREAEAREAEARYVELLRAGAVPTAQREPISSRDVLASGGRTIGVPTGGNSDVRTVTPASFDRIQNDLLSGALRTHVRPDYEGVLYRRQDGLVFGLRISRDHGLTLDVVTSNHPSVSPTLKVHQR